jgi:SAM-dependent methyltransferase
MAAEHWGMGFNKRKLEDQRRQAAQKEAANRAGLIEAKGMTNHPGFFEGTGMPDPGWWEALWPDPADVLTKVGLKSGMDVIDLCSGDGWFTLQIAKIAGHVTAIDIDEKLLQTTRTRLADAKQSNCTYVEGNAYDIATLIDRQVDFVFLANAFHGVPDKLRLARAIESVLKPGALLVIVNWHVLRREQTTVLGEPRGPATALRIGPEAVELALRQSQLRSVRTVEIPPYHYASIFQKGPVSTN